MGTPSAAPDAEPKLERMSPRTTPSSARTFTPFDPSPGNGPAVSSGITSVAEDASDAAVAVVGEVEVDCAPLFADFDAQPAIATTLAPPRSWRRRRRFIVSLIIVR